MPTLQCPRHREHAESGRYGLLQLLTCPVPKVLAQAPSVWRLQVVSSPELDRSGVYWSWNKENGSFENELSEESSDTDKARKLWDISAKLVGLG